MKRYLLCIGITIACIMGINVEHVNASTTQNIDIEKVIEDSSSSYGYDSLSDFPNGVELQKLYVDFQDNMLEFIRDNKDVESEELFLEKIYPIFKVDYDASKISTDDMCKVYLSFVYDHPAYYWLDNAIYCGEGSVVFSVDEDYYKASVREQYNQKMCEVLADLQTKTQSCVSNYDVSKKIYDIIKEKVSLADNADSTVIEDSYAYNIIGFIDSTKSKLVTEGYSKTYALILNYLDIPNIFVTGTANNNDHAWNLVMMPDGKYYAVDITLDDNNSNDAYFLKGKTTFNKDHIMASSDASEAFDYLYSIKDFATSDYEYKEDGLLKIIDEEYTKSSTTIWKYKNSVLTIDGNGSVPNYTSKDEAEWEYFSGLIKKIVIEDEIIFIGSNAFDNCENVVEINNKSAAEVKLINREVQDKYNTYTRNWVDKTTKKSITTIKNGTAVAYYPAKYILINNNEASNYTLTVGKTKKLTVSFYPTITSDKSYSWTSSNTSVATVASDGTVTAKSIGTATITATSKVDSSVKKSIKITVNCPVSNVTIGKVYNYTYTGSAITPSPSLTYAKKKLVKNTDYTLTYSNNKNAGTAKVIITGKGYYTGSKTISFKINKKSMSALSYSKISNKTYTGSAITPSVTVKNGKNVLKKGTDYTLTYSNNKNAGTATVTITGKGNYTGTKKLTFRITALSVNSSLLKYASVADRNYTGSYIKPSVTIKRSTTRLTKNKDYTITYSSNKNVGKATITIKGKGNYTGTKKITFKILPKKTSISSVKSTKNTITVKWRKVSTQVTGYQVQYSTNSSFKSAKTETISKYSTTSKVLSSLSKNKTYYVRVRTYKKVGSTNYYSGWSSKKIIKTASK